jgi:hypothetical protein
MTGCVPSACRRTQNGFFGCCLKGWAHSTSRWRRKRPLCDGSAVFTRARSGALPCWASRSSGCQIGTACPASCGAPRARSSTPPANGARHGSNNPGPCRGGHAASVCRRAYEATTITMACAGTPARSPAFSTGRWTVRLNGSPGGEASGAVTRGSHLLGSSTASRERVLVLRRFHVGEWLLEGPALHRGRAYNRGTGCGKTARPGLYGGCRVTGIPTVEGLKIIAGQ